MKKLTKILAMFMTILLLTSITARAQKVYKCDTVPGDPLKIRIYTLSNGLKVYMSVYKDAPRIQTAIAVKTGSKNDPSDNTGLSHYLEHMMFKGTENYGTKDYSQEKPLLDKIENEFEIYRKTTDSAQRKQIYHVIDSISGVASKYGIANEYDKLLSLIGAKGTNAFTSFEETVYVNDIPSNKIKPWLEVESERFSDPVFRYFHTELEAVYEEKNINLDNDSRKISEAIHAGLFKKHTYGTQTTIGTVEHLKNPSLTSLKEYYRAKYVPNNMAIFLSGDLNPSEVIKQIDSTFGHLQSKAVTPYVPPKEDPITKPIVKEILGPDAESVTIGFRLGGANTKDADYMRLFDMILNNSTAGLMDLNLNQAQKVLESGSYGEVLKDYSVEVLYGKAKENQTLEQVKDLLLEQIGKVQRGEFPDWLIPAVINNLKLSQIRTGESNSGRVFGCLGGFIMDIPRAGQIHQLDRLAKITKEEMMDFAKKNFADNYVLVYKRTGTPENVKKVVKPQITPVMMNRDDESAFLKKIRTEPTPEIQPVFLDYLKDVHQYSMKGNIPILYSKNTEDKTFSLYYYFDMGTNNDKALPIALDYLKYLGTSKYTARQIQEEFYKIGCTFNVSSSDNQLWVYLRGLSENINRGIVLFDSLLSDCKPNAESLKNLISDMRKKRSDNKLSKDRILWSAMYNYGIYGKSSPFTNIYPDSVLTTLKPEQLVNNIHALCSYQHKILFYGPTDPSKLISLLNKEHKVASTLKPVPVPIKFEQLPTNKSNVYTVDYDMKQAEIVMLSRSDTYHKEMTPIIRLFNEYFGNNMNSVVFQEIRESKGLAYSAYAGYREPGRPDQYYYLYSYIGTQNDKLQEAMKAMMGIFNSIPENDKALAISKEAIINRIRTERITKESILFNYINAQRFGLTHDIRKDVFEKIPSMTFGDLRKFQDLYLKDKNFTILVLGKKGEIDLKTLQTYGPVKELTLTDIFGY
jgi:predicted Zn-dependent peptidase